MSKIILKNIAKKYSKDHAVVRDVNLEIKDQEFLILVGPSGCGKSTTLRMIAGLEEITEGELWIDNKFSNFIDPKDRDLAMVFQNYALYPHMTVYDNLAFSLSIRKIPKKEIRQRVLEIAKILEIEHLLKRKPAELSGGQKQRVAIGSAIIRKPKAFLMDEPLSNLDAKLRNQMRVELAKLHKLLKTTIIYVTHDQVEAMTLGTRIVVMKDGVIQQIAPPDVLYDQPANKFVAGFIGTIPINFLSGSLEQEKADRYLRIGEIQYKLPDHIKLLMGRAENGPVCVGVRAENIKFQGLVNLPEKKAYLTATVVQKELLGAEAILYVQMNETQIAMKISPYTEVQKGDLVYFTIDCSKIKLFDCETEESILN
ncbi:multiple sugar ABC transporter, ATP-binding protein [Lachnospiraceae bacterium KM106-2]|nr:multiple sugar ABC transporter, ATP-binding protein [Lachnospiraceae bacterium KM106-2]